MKDRPAGNSPHVEDLLGFCAALMQAAQRGDFDGVDALIATDVNLGDVARVLAGIANQLGYLCHGREQFAQMLAAWQPGHGLPGVDRPPTSPDNHRD